MSEAKAVPTVSVTMLQGSTDPSGGRWNPGERAGFPPVIAADLIKRGIARALTDVERKAPSAPPVDKMLREKTVAKK